MSDTLESAEAWAEMGRNAIKHAIDADAEGNHLSAANHRESAKIAAEHELKLREQANNE